jgi:cell wall assembly regulator SMI1
MEYQSMVKRPSQSASVADTWKRIELWLGDHAKSFAKSLSKGAAIDQLQKLETSIGAALPDVFKQSLAIHDGQKEGCDFIPDDGIGSFYFLQTKDIAREWKDWGAVLKSGDFKGLEAKPDNGIVADWWNRGWIPFASNGGGDHLCIDLVPTKGGTVGQVILVRHDDPARQMKARSFNDWLRQLAETIENGGIDYLVE